MNNPTPRSIAELVEKWNGDERNYADPAADAVIAARRACARELQALATANGAEGLPEAEGWQMAVDTMLDGTFGRWQHISREEYEAYARIIGDRPHASIAFGPREDSHGWPTRIRPLYTADQMHAYALATRPQAASDGEAWIPVSGRLPEMDTPVWLHNQPTGDVFIGGRCDGEDGWLWCNAYASIYRDRDGWNANDMEADDDYPVTHWMPLPEPIAAMTTDAAKGDDHG